MSTEDDIQPLEPVDGIFTDLGTAILQPPKFIIKDLLPVGLVFIAAPPKSYKSTITVAMALMVSEHECNALPPFMRDVLIPGTVQLYSYEANAGELRDIAETGMGVLVRADESILVADNPWTFRLDDQDGLDKLLHYLNDRKPKLVVLDPLRDFHSLEEKDSGDMNRLLRPLRQWAVENESCLVVVHHTRKPADTQNANYEALDMRGSSALFGIADGVLILSPVGELKVRIKATFKRAAGWDRTVDIAAYHRMGEQPKADLNTMEKVVLNWVRNGLSTVLDIAKELNMESGKVAAILSSLERTGHVRKDGRKWVLA